MVYVGHGTAKFVLMVREMGVVETENAALDAYFNQSPEVAIWAPENCINRGAPYGDTKWIDEVARKLGLLIRLRPRGRAKKVP
jgi:hypothetical protein